jgi:hypothetical protein
MGRLTERDGRIAVRVGGCTKRHDPVFDKLARYEDLEEQGRLIVTIRCKDCEHFTPDNDNEYLGHCKYWDNHNSYLGYCSGAKLA